MEAPRNCVNEEGSYARMHLAEGVVVEGAAVVLPLRRALRPALLDVRHEADVGVGEGQVRPGTVHVLAVVRDCVRFVIDKAPIVVVA